MPRFINLSWQVAFGLLGLGVLLVAFQVLIAYTPAPAATLAGMLTVAGLLVHLYVPFRIVSNATPFEAGVNGQRLEALVAELSADLGISPPRLVVRAVQRSPAAVNLGAVEVGPNLAALVFSPRAERLVAAGRLPVDTLRGVLLHELAHLVHNDAYLRTWAWFGFTLLRAAVLLSLAAAIVHPATRDVLLAHPNHLLLLLATPLACSLLEAFFGRVQELRADAVARRAAGGGEVVGFLDWLRADLLRDTQVAAAATPDAAEALATELEVEANALIAAYASTVFAPRLRAEGLRLSDPVELGRRLRAALASDPDVDHAKLARLFALARHLRATAAADRRRRSRPLYGIMHRVGCGIGLIGRAWVGRLGWIRAHPSLERRRSSLSRA